MSARKSSLVIEMQSTEAKNNFGSLMEKVESGVVVQIVRRDKPKAVVLSMERYEGLVAAQVDPLASLRAQFDARFEKMQTPAFRKGVDALFKATPAQLGKAAVKAATAGKKKAAK